MWRLIYINRQLGELAKRFEEYEQMVTEDKAKYRKPRKKVQKENKES